MTASNPLIQKIIKFTLGGTDFSQDIIDIRLEPVPGDETKVVTLDGIAHIEVGTESWQFVINAVVDDDSVRPGLAYYLNANKGTTVAYVYNPRGTGAESATAPQYTGSVKVQPFTLGGDGNTFAEHEVTLPCTAAPTRDATP